MRLVRAFLLLCTLILSDISSYSVNTPQSDIFKFKLLNQQNKVVTENSFKGKVTILNFGTLDSEASLKEKILLERFLKENHDLDINFIPIIIGNSKDVNSFVNMNKFSYDFYTDPNNDLKKRLDVNIIPSTYILNEKGVLVYKHVGILDFNELKRILELLNGIYTEGMYGIL